MTTLLLHPRCPFLLWMRLLILVAVIPLLVTVAIEKEDDPICQLAASEDSSNAANRCDAGRNNMMNERAQFDALVAWIRSLGGFVDDRIVLRRRDSTSTRGMFVTDKVAQGEKLFYVPNEAIIASEDHDWFWGSDRCKAARALARELTLGNKSKYAPFVQILRDSGHPGPPSFWSEPGRALLDTVLGRHLPPQDYMREIEQWHPKCDNEALSDQHIILYTTRVVRSMMVPLFVFVNHRNRPWTNLHFNIDKQGLGAVTLQDVAKDQELFFSYGNGTHIMFRNFGFVEPFPQRWVFDFGGIVQFDLDKVVDSSSQKSNGSGGQNASFSVTWINGGPPSKDTIELLRTELVRLATLMSMYGGTNNDDIPREEKELILQYHRALTFAISHAIRAAEVDSTATSV